MNKRNLVFVDTETTGLDPRKHEVIEVAWIKVSPRMTELQRYEARILPSHVETAEQAALDINGYSKEAWEAGAVYPETVVANAFAEAARDAILVAHNITFDEGFMTALLLRAGVTPTWHYHKVDTCSLAWPLFATGKLSGLSLSKLCAHFGIKQERAHSAMSDAENCLSAYKELMKLYIAD